MSVLSLDAWRNTLTASGEAGYLSDEAWQRAYALYRQHPDASLDEQRAMLQAASGHTGSGTDLGSIGGVLAPWVGPTGPVTGPASVLSALAGGSSSSEGGGAADPTKAPPAAPGAQPSPDLASAAQRAGAVDPALAAILGGAGGAAATNVQLWSGLGVDPQALAFGQVGVSRSHISRGRGRGELPGPPVSPINDTRTVDTWLKGLYKMGPEALGQLQMKLWSGGWYKNTKVTDPSQLQIGRPDPYTLQAYADALGETARYGAAQATDANGNPYTIQAVIAMGAPGGPGANTGTGAPYVTTNPADLKSALKTQAQQVIGRDPSKAEQDAYAQQYIASEAAARRQIIAAQGTNTTVGVEGPPSPTAGAEEYIDLHNLADKVAYGAAVRQQAFLSMLKSPV